MHDLTNNNKFLTVGGVACVKTRKHKKLNYGQTVVVKNIIGTTVTVIPDSDEPVAPSFMDAKDLHTSEMTYL
jgi:hypothetical protein